MSHFKNTISQNDTFMLEEYLKLAINNQQLPQFLCKYRSIESASIALEQKSLWFSSPMSFNDPFDCQIIPDTDNTPSEIYEYFVNQNYSPEEASKLAKNASKDHKWGETIAPIISDKINSSKICCFTSNEHNILMWSHYGDSHKGLCLKFDVLKDLNFFLTPLPVNYRRDYPKFNYLRNQPNIVHDMILSKSIHWSYESEIRVIKQGLEGALNFDKSSLTEVIFGCNCCYNDINKIKDILIKNSYNVVLKQARVNSNLYELDILPL